MAGLLRKSLSLGVATCIVATSVSFASGNKEVKHTYNTLDGNYIAEKLSHPNSGVGEADGIIDYENGDADRGQSYSWSSASYDEYLYIGTCYSAVYNTMQKVAYDLGFSMDQFKGMQNILYNGDLYLGDENNPTSKNRAVLIKLDTETLEVSIVQQPKVIGGYRAAIEFNDKLYFCATGGQGGKPHLLEVDPTTDETKIVYQSPTVTDPTISTGIRGLTVVGDTLVSSMIGDNGAYIVASSNPSGGQETFKTIATQEDLLDYPAYKYSDSVFGGSIWDMVSLNDKLYFTVVTGKDGDKSPFAMFVGEEDKNGDWSFEVLVGKEEDNPKYPLGLGAERSGAANLEVHDGYIYIGGYNDPMTSLLNATANMDFEQIYDELSNPVNLWRMDSNENIELVAGEPNKLFPKVVGNQTSGFGNNLNQYVWDMESYDDKLYVGTFNVGSMLYPLMQFTNGDVLDMTEEELKELIGYVADLIEILIKENGTSTITTDESTIDLLNELNENLEAMSGLLDDTYEDSSNSRAASSQEKLLKILKVLSKIYPQIKDQLDPEVVKVLDQLLNEDTIENISYFVGTCEYLSKGERGFNLLVSEDGKNFDVITNNGFGDPYNHGLRTFSETSTGLCIGTANPFNGTQVWRLTEKTTEDTTTPDNTIKPVSNLTKDIYKYDAGSGNYLTYINGKGYSQYSYLNTSGNYAFTPSSWMRAAGLDVTMPTVSNGYKMSITNPYIQKAKDLEAVLSKAKAGKLHSDKIQKEIDKFNSISYTEKTNVSKVSSKKTLTKDIYRYDVGKENQLTYISGKGYSQFTYLNASGKYAFTPSSWMKAAGLDVSMPNESNGYTMQINNTYVKKCNDIVKELKDYLK